ncbi:MAG: PSD1 and planctomycete cytochrome C domain-containing protein [Gemmataceae bacterium]
MRANIDRWLVTCLVVWALSPNWVVGQEKLSFEQHARPVLKAYCLDCHGGGEKLRGGLDLRLRRFLVAGGDSGASVVPGKPAESLLIQRMKSGQMPPGEKKVPPEQIALLEKWIASGAGTTRAEPEKLAPGIDITPEERAYWFFQPLKRPLPPAYAATERVRTPIDAFILARLRDKKVGFMPDADRLTLARRASMDLLGLMPSPAELDTFLRDASPTAYEQFLDRLLASPHYGERWARHWLDVAGYADSDGNGNDDTPRPYAYKYRDWVVRALNQDLPLNQFLIEQVAGDELVARPWNNLTAEQANRLAATGFLRMAPDTSPGMRGEAQTMTANQMVADAVKTFSSAVLGLSVGCAQCHDHRYDPIPQADYFRLRAIFEPALDINHWREPSQRLVSLYTDADRARAAAVEAEAQKMRVVLEARRTKLIHAAVERELAKFPEPKRAQLKAAYFAAKRTPEQTKLLEAHPSVNINGGVLYQYDEKGANEIKAEEAKIAAKLAEKPVQDFVSVLDEMPGVVPVMKVHYRGDPRQPKQEVQPGDLTIAAPDGKRFELPPSAKPGASSGRRLAYATYLTNGKHPLVGRVLANRLWLHHFGRGLVDTPGDFGLLGLRPSHPELLDWLADELVARGWSLKQMHRLIMLSTVYRQSSRRDGTSAAIEDALYPRYPLRRLDAEALRDRVLQVSGRLDPRFYGPAVPVIDDGSGEAVPEGDSGRRSLYLQVRRSQPVSLLNAFDAPAMTPNCDRRTNSTAATQSLMLMNGTFLLKQAETLANRVAAETPTDFASPLGDPVELARAASAWSYGYGGLDEKDRRVVQFTQLPHWTGSSWQGGATLPDAKTDWAMLHAQGGHAGSGLHRAAIRRWKSPFDGVVTLRGTLQHPAPAGDGVRGRIVSSRLGVLGEWHVHNRKQPFALEKVSVQRGDTIDFVADCFRTVETDSFVWTIQIEGPTLAQRWDSVADFQGPAGPSLARQIAFAWQTVYHRPIAADEMALAVKFAGKQLIALRQRGASGNAERQVLTNLCQQLLGSNEFLYVD